MVESTEALTGTWSTATAKVSLSHLRFLIKFGPRWCLGRKCVVKMEGDRLRNVHILWRAHVEGRNPEALGRAPAYEDRGLLISEASLMSTAREIFGIP